MGVSHMKPIFSIIADGTDQTVKFQDRLIGLTLTDEAGQKSDTVQIVLDNRDNLIALPPMGAKLDISLGFRETGLTAMGRYVVDDLSGKIFPATLTIDAKAADMRGDIKAPKTRAWEGVTLGDIAAKIAGEHSLKLAIAPSLKSQAYPYLAQTAESELHFLTRLARDLDATAKAAGGALVLVKRGEGKASDGSDLPVHQIHQDQMTRASWKATGRGRYGKVCAEWCELGSATVHKVYVGDGKPTHKLRHRHATKDEATRAAQSALDRGKRSSGTISVQLAGFQGDLLAEGKVDIQGIHPELTGEWLVTSVTHRLGTALATSFEAERDNEKEKKEG